MLQDCRVCIMIIQSHLKNRLSFTIRYVPSISIEKPKAYIIPQGWHDVIARLKLNSVIMHQLKKDTTINVEYYLVDDYKSMNKPYEKHHRNYDIHLSTKTDSSTFFKRRLYHLYKSKCKQVYY